MYKPGYKTTEFWITLISFMCSGLYLIGIISFEDKNSTTDVLAHGVESIILIAGQAAVFMRYIKSRSEVKQKVLDQESIVKEKSQSDNRRKSSTRNKSSNRSTKNKSRNS